MITQLKYQLYILRQTERERERERHTHTHTHIICRGILLYVLFLFHSCTQKMQKIMLNI